MKTWMMKSSSMVFAAGLLGALACGGGESSCGGAPEDTDSYAAPPPVVCPAGYVQSSTNKCAPVKTNNGTSSARTASSLSTSGN